MRFVQRDLEYARHHLHAAGKALGRGVDERQLLRFDPAIARDARDQFGWRWAAAFHHQCCGYGTIPVAELVEQRFAARERARRSRPKREEGIRTFALGQAPAGILAGEASGDGIGRMHH